MAQIETEQLQLKEIYQLSFDIFSKYGCDNNNATALARTVETAERDGSPVSYTHLTLPTKRIV